MSATVSVLDGLDGFRAQVLIWGYAIQGQVCETAAMAAENQHHDERLWDGTARSLADRMIARADEPYRRVRDWAALTRNGRACEPRALSRRSRAPAAGGNLAAGRGVSENVRCVGGDAGSLPHCGAAAAPHPHLIP